MDRGYLEGSMKVGDLVQAAAHAVLGSYACRGFLSHDEMVQHTRAQLGLGVITSVFPEESRRYEVYWVGKQRIDRILPRDIEPLEKAA